MPTRRIRIPRSIGLVIALVAGLALTGCGGSGGGGSDDDGNAKVVPGAREIPVEGKSFEYGPDIIDVDAGEDVTIVLKSTDIFHDFVVEDRGTIAGANGGETAKGGLRINKPGSYEFYCSIAGHRSAGMEGTLVVE